MEKLVRKYADQPMDFADASVVILATRTGVREILTADRRDFSVYRLGGRARFIDVLAIDGSGDPPAACRTYRSGQAAKKRVKHAHQAD